MSALYYEYYFCTPENGCGWKSKVDEKKVSKPENRPLNRMHSGMGQALPVTGKGGALALSFPVMAPHVGGKPLEADTKQYATCWILNDDPLGTIRGIARQFKFEVLKLPDQRL